MTHQTSKNGFNTTAIFYGYIIVTIAFFINFTSFGANGAFGVFFNPMLTELGWTRAVTSGAFSVSWIMQGVLSIYMGRLNDKLGPRLVMSICGLFLGAGYLLMSLVDDIWKFYIFYGIIIGIGMSGIFVSLSSTVVHWFTRKRGFMTGIFQAGSGIGTLAMTPLAHLLITTYNWQTSYLIFGIIILVVVLITAQFLRLEAPKPEYERESATVAQTSIGLDTNALSVRDASKTRQFWIMIGISACTGFPIYIVMVHLVPHTIDLGIAEATAASILATVGAAVTAGRLIFGIIADKIGFKNVVGIGFLLLALAMFALIFATEPWMFYILATVLGFAWGSAISHAPLTAELFGLGAHGFILGFVSLGYTMGTAMGPLFGGYIYDITKSYLFAFIAGGTVSAIGLVLIMLLAPLSKAKEVIRI